VPVGATEFVDKTIADGVFSPDIWSKQVLRATESNLVFAKCVDRGYEDDASVGKSVKVASIGNVAARAKTENTAITYETVAETATTITLNIWSYAAVGIEDIVKVQSIVDVQNEYQMKMGYAVARDIDTKLATDVAGFSQTVGTLGTPLADVDVVRANQYLDDADAPEDDRFMIMSPAEKANKITLDRWSNALYIGNPKPAVTGSLGEMYGLNLFVTTNLVKPAGGQANNVVMQRDAIALIVQRSPKMHLFYDIDFFTWKLASEVIYGHQEMRDNFGVWAKGVG
jgi:N4-gp56 family major capsid protein